MRWNLPNTLTVMRLVSAPLLMVVFLVFPRPVSDWLAVALFAFAALSDFVDGYLARRWQQVSAFGKMLDPIADKAMTVLALVLLVNLLNGLNFQLGKTYVDESTMVLIPATFIMFREVFVSGLREYMGSRSSSLPVTFLAKWKTASQMVAILVLFVQGLFEHYFGVLAFGLTRQMTQDILAGKVDDLFGLGWKYEGFIYSQDIGIGLLWIAMVLTLVTGFDYFRKCLPILKEEDNS